MARITVEDCVTRVPNRFELVLLAAHRARELSKGYPPTVDYDDDKNHVVALREIAEGTIAPEDLVESIQTALMGGEEDTEPGPEADDGLAPMEMASGKIDWDRALREPEDDAEDADTPAYLDDDADAMNDIAAGSGGFEDVPDDFADFTGDEPLDDD